MSEFAGKTAVIQIVDQATGGWGHINVDHIVQTDRKPPGLLANAKREFKIDKRYLNLPIKNGAPKRVVTTLVDGRVEVRNDIELANAEPDWWAPMDVSAWRGQDGHAPSGQAARGFHRAEFDRAERRHQRRGEPLPRAVARAVSFLAAARLEQRSERPGVLQRRVSPLLPAQPLRLGLGQHALGPRRQPRPGPLAGTGRQARARRHGADVQRQRGGGLEQHQRPRQGRQAGARAHLHRRRQPHRAVPRFQHRWPDTSPSSAAIRS